MEGRERPRSGRVSNGPTNLEGLAAPAVPAPRARRHCLVAVGGV
jgi:hypothetical protein